MIETNEQTTTATLTRTERLEATATVEVVQVLADQTPPAVRLLTRGTDAAGNARCHLQHVLIRDAALLARLLGEVAPGVPIRAYIVTEWSENNYASYLEDFALFGQETAS